MRRGSFKIVASMLVGVLIVLMSVLLWQWRYILVFDALPRHIPVLLKTPQAFLGHPPEWLRQSWGTYKATFLQADGRIQDPDNHGITTSEGQSYALQQAVWLNDQATFDRLWQWTRDNLQVSASHHLFAWKWGQKPSTTQWGVLDEGVAADADQDMAFALLMAHERWKSPAYKKEALAILKDLWRREVVDSAWGPVLLAGDWYRFNQHVPNVVLLNPSYGSPALYRVFAAVDKEHPWEALGQSIYRMWQASFALSQMGLPPDWVWFDRQKGRIYPKQDDKTYHGMSSRYGYEACRLPWRLYLDVALTRAYHLANPTGEALLKTFRQRVFQQFPEVSDLEGHTLQPFGSPANAGALWPMVVLEDTALYQRHAHQYDWPSALNNHNYYGRNWLWFGVWLQVFQQSKLQRSTPLPPLLPALTYALDPPASS
ncbi:MAG: hypothetical protein HEQ32_03030 [Vampirovibrio sp.]